MFAVCMLVSFITEDCSYEHSTCLCVALQNTVWYSIYSCSGCWNWTMNKMFMPAWLFSKICHDHTLKDTNACFICDSNTLMSLGGIQLCNSLVGWPWLAILCHHIHEVLVIRKLFEVKHAHTRIHKNRITLPQNKERNLYVLGIGMCLAVHMQYTSKRVSTKRLNLFSHLCQIWCYEVYQQVIYSSFAAGT
jgi:hypothetical protein